MRPEESSLKLMVTIDFLRWIESSGRRHNGGIASHHR
jgi:hypothetical protein